MSLGVTAGRVESGIVGWRDEPEADAQGHTMHFRLVLLLARSKVSNSLPRLEVAGMFKGWRRRPRSGLRWPDDFRLILCVPTVLVCLWVAGIDGVFTLGSSRPNWLRACFLPLAIVLTLVVLMYMRRPTRRSNVARLK